jgi:sodium/potassium-transporting ATPase subunit alpha
VSARLSQISAANFHRMKVPPRKPVTPETVDIFRRRALRRKGSRYDEESGEIITPESMTKMQKLAHNLRQLVTKDYWVDKFENTGAEVLVDGPLLSWAYLEIGIIEAIASLTAYFVVMNSRGISPRDARLMQKGAGKPTQYFTPSALPYNGIDAATQVDILAEAQSMVYFSIMTTQMFNIFACKSRLKLPFGKYMFANRATFYSILGGASLAIFVIYTPGIEKVFKTSRNLLPLYWLIPMAFGVVLIGYSCLRTIIRMKAKPIQWNPDIHGLQMYPTIRTTRTMSVRSS